MTTESLLNQYPSLPGGGSNAAMGRGLNGSFVPHQQSQQQQLQQHQQHLQQLHQQQQQQLQQLQQIPLHRGSNSSNTSSSNSGNSSSTSLLKVSNLPANISPREAVAIFSLVLDDVVNVELIDYTIFAYFSNISTCLTTGKLLEGKFIFGPEYPPVKVEYDSNTINQANNAFASLQISNLNPLQIPSGSSVTSSLSGIPGISSQTQHLNQSASATSSTTNPHQQQQQQSSHGASQMGGLPSQGPQPPHQLAQQMQQQVPPPPHLAQNQLHGLGQTGPSQEQGEYDNLKRQSISQRSRFLFSEPFQPNAASSATGVSQPPQGVVTTQGQNGAAGVVNGAIQTPVQASQAPTSTTGPPPQRTSTTGIDLNDITGKSILLMESQNDAKEYESLVRDPWGNQVIATNNQGPASSAAGPNGPGNPGSFDWNAQGGPTANGPPVDRRRASSAFFSTNPTSLHPLTTSSASSMLGSQLAPGTSNSLASGPSNSSTTITNPGTGTTTPVASQPVSALTSGSILNNLGVVNQPLATGEGNGFGVSLNTQAGIPSASSLSTLPLEQIKVLPTDQQKTGSSPPLGGVAVSQQQEQPKPSLASVIANPPPPKSTSTTTVPSAAVASASNTTKSNSTTKESIPDLSLLARVPPPANPADQNPPCNTLYVGNLPPDATEGELRTLFSPQKGFRRLSFRTKSTTTATGANHNHGPMCFVEFEDVAHATRALAELYGLALPRPGGNGGKGGIRLLFSKNPLGVRGPGNSRRSSMQSVPTTGGSVGYQYQGYHKL